MILRDFAIYLAMILATFLMLALVFTFFELLTDIVRNKVSFILLAAYLLNLSPSLIYLMAPMSVMLAVLITFGLLQKSSEFTAMKATGFSIYRATFPVIVLAASIRHRPIHLRSGLHPAYQPAPGDLAQPDQGQAAADILASRSQVDFWRVKPDLLLPGLRS